MRSISRSSASSSRIRSALAFSACAFSAFGFSAFGVYSFFSAAAFFGVSSFFSPPSPVFFAGAAFAVFPSRISARFRFMALHMICVRRSPEEPTIPPTATRRTLEIAIPAIAPATPDRELRSEMATGISAPPTRIANAHPKRRAATAQSTTATPVTPNAASRIPRTQTPRSA